MANKGYKNEYRIVAGAWRGRRCAFPPGTELRPTPDRVRETLFNWLMPRIKGARCLDLFAGAGALGTEALSRGASRVVFVEREDAAARAIRENLDRLEAQNAEVLAIRAEDYLSSVRENFDVVFLDPPFSAGLLENLWEPLQPCLAPGARVYVEFPLASGPPPWPLVKSSRAGRVGFALAAPDD